MKRWLLLGLLGLLLLLAACQSEEPSGPDIEAEGVWARPAVMGDMGADQDGHGGMGGPMPGTGAVFMTLQNRGDEADRLMSAQTDVAQVVEVHETMIQGDVAKMQQITGGIELPAGGSVTLKPGGYHIMLIGLKRDLGPGDTFNLMLNFETSQDLNLEVEVRQP